VNILNRNAKYIYKIINGIKHTNAKTGNPAVTNEYNASKNKRKSNNTLPLFSREYATT
jgi:hypothetical protein